MTFDIIFPGHILEIVELCTGVDDAIPVILREAHERVANFMVELFILAFVAIIIKWLDSKHKDFFIPLSFFVTLLYFMMIRVHDLNRRKVLLE